MDLADLRDIVIIVYGVLGILLFLIMIGLSVAIFMIIRRLQGLLSELVRETVRPTLDEVNQTVHNVRGASEFVADRAVHPVIRVLAFGRGIRRGAGAITGLRSRIRK